MNRKGFPHSEIPGSKLVCSSPRLIAAYRVLHRLLAPRHSPYALSSLTTSVSNSRQGPVLSQGGAPSCVRSLLTLRRLLEQLLRRFERLYLDETPLRRFARYCVLRKELPFAGYSVVKELSILARLLACASSARVEPPNRLTPVGKSWWR